MSDKIVREVVSFLEEVGSSIRQARQLVVSEKAPADLVTDLDKELEQKIRGFLPTLKPGSVVVGEEFGGSPAEWTWWVDPLDGTTNCVHGWPRLAVSVALYHHHEAELAAVRDPYLEESFWAAQGQGAWLGKKRLQVSEEIPLNQALLCTGFAPEPLAQWELCRRLQAASRGIRVSGCASLDFAYVAAGRADAFLEVDLKAWDVAAGMLLVREAGGVVTDYTGKAATLESGNFIAAQPSLAETILHEIRDCGL